MGLREASLRMTISIGGRGCYSFANLPHAMPDPEEQTPMAQEWTTPAMAGAPPQPAPAFELRPLSLGEILDRTFAIYRTRFWLFAGLASIYGATSALLSGLQATIQHMIMTHLGPGVAQVEATASSGLVYLLALPVGAVVQTAILFALSEVYLGRATTVGASLRAMAGRWYRWMGVMLWQAWSLMWVPMLVLVPAVVLTAIPGTRNTFAVLSVLLIFLAIFGGGAYGVYAYLRNSLALPAAAVEGGTVRVSMRRSKVLTVGAKGRVFMVGLVVWVLSMVAGVVQMPLAFVVARTPLEAHIAAHAMIMAINFLTVTVVSPVGMIGLALVYFDQRVRQEGFDLLLMMGPETPQSPAFAEGTLGAAETMGNDGGI